MRVIVRRFDHYETVRQRKDGSLVDISITVSPIKNEKGEIIGASKIARDITQLKRARVRRSFAPRLRVWRRNLPGLAARRPRHPPLDPARTSDPLKSQSDGNYRRGVLTTSAITIGNDRLTLILLKNPLFWR
jgi:hypothetical protein